MLIRCQVGSNLLPGVWDPGEWDVRGLERSLFQVFLLEKEKGLGRWELEAC